MNRVGVSSQEKEPVRSFDADVSLRAILAALPEDTMLPAGWVLARIAGRESQRAGSVPDTLNAQEFGEQRVPRRTADWVREKCAEGRFDGAHKDGGEWRIPRSALQTKVPRARSNQLPGGQTETPDGRQRRLPAFPRW